jgi:hypothetical protein
MWAHADRSSNALYKLQVSDQALPDRTIVL